MANCTYIFKDNQGESVTLAGIPALKAYLVMGGLEQFDMGMPEANQAKLGSTITINGQERSTFNSLGNPIAQDEQSIRNFWEWFEDSKVVDELGRPLVVYHATNNKFEEFDKNKIGSMTDDGMLGHGFYFSPDKKHITWISENTKAVYLKSDNSVVVGATDSIQNVMRKNELFKNETGLSENLLGEKTAKPKKITEILQKNNYDGVIKKDNYGADEYVVFEPDQIKSADTNTGEFSPTNNDIRFSIASPQDLWDDAAEIPNSTYKDVLNKLGFGADKARSRAKEIGLSALTQKQLTGIGAEIFPILKQFDVEGNNYDVEESTWHNRADKLANQWEKLVPKDKKRNKLEQMRLAEMMHEMTVSGVDPRKPVVDIKPRDIAKYRELKAKYDKLLPVIKGDNTHPGLLNEVEKFHADVVKRLKQSIIKKIADTEMPVTDKEKLINEIDKKFQTQKGPYFPLMRFGDYWVDYNGGVEMFGTKKEQSDFIAAKKKEGIVINGFGKSLNNFNKVEGVDIGFVDKIGELVDKLDVAQADTLKDEIFQLYLNALPETSMRKRFIHRKKTPGWEQDALRSFAKKSFHDGKQLAKVRFAPAMLKVLRDVELIIKTGNSTNQQDLVNRHIKLIPELMEKLDNANRPDFDLATYEDVAKEYENDKVAQDLINRFKRFGYNEPDRNYAMKKYLQEQKDLLKAAEAYQKKGDKSETAADILKALHKSYANMMDSNTSPLTNFINQSVFTFFLGFNPASALINYFQTPGVALPVIAGRHGFVQASREFAKASKDFFTHRHNDDNSFSIQSGLTDPGEKLMYQAFTNNGTFDRTRSHDLSGLSEEGIARGTLHRDIMLASTYMFNKAEIANREITALMAYRMEYKKTGDVQKSIEYANDIVNQTHLDYSSKNRPNLFQGNAARVMLQFKMYSQGITYLWGKTAYDALISKDATPERKAEAKKILLSLVGVQISMAGVLGLPIGGLLMAAQALAGLGDDDDDPIDVEVEIRKALSDLLGEDLGRIVSKGALSETGADFSSRLSLQDLWIREPDRELEGKDKAYYLLKTVAGPVAGIIEDVLTGMKLIDEGNTERGIEKMLPHSVSGLAKSYRMIEEGGATSLTGNLIYETDAWEKVIQALGMRPSGLAEQQLQNSAIKNHEQAFMDARQKLVNKAAKAKMNNEMDDFKEAMADIKSFNVKYPKSKITIQTISRNIKARKANQSNAINGIVSRKKFAFIREEEKF